MDGSVVLLAGGCLFSAFLVCGSAFDVSFLLLYVTCAYFSGCVLCICHDLDHSGPVLQFVLPCQAVDEVSNMMPSSVG